MDLDKLKHHEKEIKKCFRCSLCKMTPLAVYRNPKFSDSCPINSHYQFHAYSGSGLQFMALALAQGRIEPDEKLAEIVFSCRSCGFCDVACKFIMDAERHLVNMAFKETLVDAGLAPVAYKKTAKNIKENGFAFSSKRQSWAQGLELKNATSKKAPVLLWAGCSADTDPAMAETLRTFVKILNKAQVNFAVLGEHEACCGLPAYWSGFREEFTHAGHRAAALIEKTGAKTVVAVCGGCLGAMRSKFPAYGIRMSAEVLHATEFIERLIKKKKLRMEVDVPLKVTYHDPCYLGRQSEAQEEWRGVEKTVFGQVIYTDPPRKTCYGSDGVFDPPRMILGAMKGVDFKEMHRIREYALCCGAGGGQAPEFKDMAENSAVGRIEEAIDTGAQCLVTSCPHCRRHFEETAKTRKLGIEVMDIVDLIARAANIA